MTTPINFEELFRKENELLAKDPGSTRDKSDLSDLDTETPGPAGEPWIRYTPIDRVGLAFSGGGIRSATFNLGVFKGAARTPLAQACRLSLHGLRRRIHRSMVDGVAGALGKRISRSFTRRPQQPPRRNQPRAGGGEASARVQQFSFTQDRIFSE